MSPESILSFVTQPYTLAALAALGAFWASARVYPVINLLARKKNLMGEPGVQGRQNNEVPSYGGPGIFITFSVLALSLACLGNCTSEELSHLLTLMAALSILFFLGLKEDMMGLDPAKNLIGQLLAAGIVVLLPGVRLQGLDGVFGIGELPYGASVGLTFLVLLLVANAYKLIDRIDGLAGAIALIASIVFGSFFLVSGYQAMALASFILVGALLGLLRFNLTYTKSMSMGSSGSLFLGFLLACMAVLFLNRNREAGAILSNAPVIVLSVLSFPLLHALRAFIPRARNARRPSPTGRGELPRLTDQEAGHKQATALIALKTLLILTVCWILQDIPINLHLFVMWTLSIGVYYGSEIVSYTGKALDKNIRSLDTSREKENEKLRE